MNYSTTALLIIWIFTSMHLFAAAQSSDGAIQPYGNGFTDVSILATIETFDSLCEQKQLEDQHILPFLHMVPYMPRDDLNLKSILQIESVIKNAVIRSAVLAHIEHNDSTYLDILILGYGCSRRIASLSLADVLRRHMATAVRSDLKAHIKPKDIRTIVTKMLKTIPESDLKYTCRKQLHEELRRTAATEHFFQLPKIKKRTSSDIFVRKERKLPRWLRPYFDGVSIQDYTDHDEKPEIEPFTGCLDLSFMSIKDLRGLENLNTRYLRILKLNNNKIKILTFEDLVHQYNLQSIDVRDNMINSIEIGSLITKPHLLHLDITGNPIIYNQTECRRIKQEIRKRTT